MLSRECFARGMAIVQDRYGRQLQPATMTTYYARLANALTDAEFTAGVQLAIDAPFMPAPGDIIAAAKPPLNHKLHAEQLWSDVLTAIRRTPWRMISRAAFADHEWKTIAAVGGLDAVANMTDTAEPHVHRRFLEAYVERATALGNQERATMAIEAIDPRARVLVERTVASIGGGNGSNAAPPSPLEAM